MLTQYEQFWRQLTTANRLAVVINKHWPGDSLASGLALSQLLIKLQHRLTLAADPGEKQTQLSWLPLFSFIQPALEGARSFVIHLDTGAVTVKDLKYRLTPGHLEVIISQEEGMLTPESLTTEADGFPYDAVITLGCPDFDCLGSVYEQQPGLWQQTAIINIDCQAANEGYGQINLIDTKATSVSEVVWQLFADKTELIDADIATCLLAGIIAATNNFKNPNLAAATLSAAAELLNLGARREEIVNRLYRDKKIDTLKLWGAGLTHLSVASQEKLAWTFVDYQDIEDLHLKRQDLIALARELIGNLSTLEVVIIFISRGQETLAFVYSLKNFDALALTKNYQGQGTRQLAQVLLNRPLAEAIKELAPVINNQLND